MERRSAGGGGGRVIIASMVTTKAEETRNRILDAALQLFRERGFAETTMRDVAAAAGVATGAAYYYYRSKEDLVMAFYVRTDQEAAQMFAAALVSSKKLEKRIRGLIEAKFTQFSEHRALLTALLKAGVDPREPLSPFGEETRAVREENIAWYARALEGSDVKLPKDIADDVPRLLWLYHMGLIYFWITDDSKGQVRTRRLLDATLELVVQLLKAASLPFMGPLRKKAVKVMRAFE